MAEHGNGGGGNIDPHRQLWRALPARRDRKRAQPAGERERHHQHAEQYDVAAVTGGEPSRDGAGKNGDEGGAFDQRIGRRQPIVRQMIGQDAVFDRAEQCRYDPEAGERDEHDGDRLVLVAVDRKGGDKHLGEFHALRHARLVEAVGEFAGEPREKEERRDKHRAGQRDQRATVLSRHLEQDEEDQRGLEEIVVERREELAPEQGREAPRQHERRHGAVIAGVPAAGVTVSGSDTQRALVPAEGFEPPTPRLRSGCSTAELRRLLERGPLI